MTRISGVTIVRNGVKLGYPFIESIRSLLPVCDEVIVGVGDSEDDTRARVEALGDPRVRIIDTVWDMSRRTGGLILSEQTNLAMSRCAGDWIFYIQADEVALERDFDSLRAALDRAEKDPGIDGLAFRYVHFYGSYYTVQKGRNWYGREVRVVRNGRGIVSHGDAQGFRRDGRKIRALEIPARMYHYGWARPPEVMVEKIKSFHRFWHDDAWIRENCAAQEMAAYFSDLGNLAPFDGEHPGAMAGTINRDSEQFIAQLRGEYLKKRTFGQAFKDFLRGLPLASHKNYRT